MSDIRKKILTVGLIVLLGCIGATLLWGAVTAGAENWPAVKNLEFINVDLRQVFRSLAVAGRFNVILDQTVKGTVSIAFKSGITPREAVMVIAGNYGYSFKWLPDSQTVLIGAGKTTAGNLNDKIMIDIPLKYIDAGVAAGSLETVIPKERIKPDSGGHKLVVFGNSLELQNVNEIITKIDRPLASVNVEVKIAEVTDAFWSRLQMDHKVVRSHFGIYPVPAPQAKVLADPDTVRLLARRYITLFDNQEGKLFFGDQYQKPAHQNNIQPGAASTATVATDIGTVLQITSWVGEGNQITLQIKETTLIPVIKAAALKNETMVNYSSREVTSIIRIEAGQTFILTGLIERDEFERLKKIPGNYPVLNELFTAAEQPRPKTATQVIALITPCFSDAFPNQTAPRDNYPADMAFNVDSSRDSSGDSSRTKAGTQADGTNGEPGNTSACPVTMVEYLVKESDTLAGIGVKFNIDWRAISAANHGDNQAMIIKPDSILLIPVPDDRIYTIKPGETLWRIAKRYGVTLELLMDLNYKITDEKIVKAGQKIVLPVTISQIKNPQF